MLTTLNFINKQSDGHKSNLQKEKLVYQSIYQVGSYSYFIHHFH